MNVEDLNEYVNEESVRGELTREMLGILSDFENKKIDKETKDMLIRSVEQGFHAEDAHSDEQTSKFLRKAVDALLTVV